MGALVRWSAGGKIRSRLATSGGSYLSSHNPRLVLGIGSAKSANWLEVRWPGPSKKTQRVSSPPLNRYSSLSKRAVESLPSLEFVLLWAGPTVLSFRVKCEYSWNSRAAGGFAPSTFDEGVRRWHVLMKNQEMPEAVFGPAGLFSQACARVYGPRAGGTKNRSCVWYLGFFTHRRQRGQ